MLTQKQINKLVDEGKIIYCVDIDDTLLDFETHKPIGKMWELIAHFNKAYMRGDYIYIHTARDFITKTITEIQLKKIGMKYHEIIFNKPKYTIQIDDSTINTLDYMKNPVYYDMVFKRLAKFINNVIRKRGI